ncbi:hypothetical protein AB840_03420 [Megasphaera cerevisiae DSM 20462]|uniref:CpXC domain-containing protein n=2 Tax=Megasphaera TaxID=906 RepID=A0A0J6ZQN6_9FIRM|nr:CpXC domain-containing protein [Megasphaera cerevisiae]KMO87276.1 hypothetical protein AB840_03420 [Megasphaera cerevisiae DSM 20462]SJZ49216.1 CpXC protein [Megasphaera cerevisiae DSM 20462]
MSFDGEGAGSHAAVFTLTCPACKGTGTFHTWDCIDGTRDPALRLRILTDETLFFYECPHCKAQIHMESPCLYIDRNQKYMVWHIPDLTVPVTSQEVCDFLGQPSFDDYTCRVALTWGEWREKIIEMESAYDDRIYEIIKFGAYQLIKEEDRQRLLLEAYHLDYADESRRSDQLALVFMQEHQKGMGYTYEITSKVLEVTRDIFMPLLERLSAVSEKAAFERRGYAWAQHFMTYAMKAASAGNGREAYGQLIGFWIQTLGQELFHADIKMPESQQNKI